MEVNGWWYAEYGVEALLAELSRAATMQIETSDGSKEARKYWAAERELWGRRYEEVKKMLDKVPKIPYHGTRDNNSGDVDDLPR